MKIRRPKGITGLELGLVTIIGILGGIYIWKPVFVKLKDTKEDKD